MKKVLALLGVITLFAVILRIYYLGKTPVSLEWDEVALGYDAYSILKTGRDQFGQYLPNNFRSLDDWKPPLYVYSTVPAVAIFGLTEFAVRFPSAFFGITAVFLTFFLVRELLENIADRERNMISLLSSLFLAISPWHLQFSRAAFETNLSVTVTIGAVLTFLLGIRGRMGYFMISAFLFGLALFSYHSTRVVTPLILVFLLIFFRQVLPSRRIIIAFFLIYAVFVFFFLPIAGSRNAQIRFLVTNDLRIEENQFKAASEIIRDETQGQDQLLAGKIFHNRRIIIYNYENFLRLAQNYLSHFSPKFLVAEGDAPLHHPPGFGMIYFFDYFFIMTGIYFYIRKLYSRYNLILPFWLLVGPLPASVTWQAPHSVRAEIILPTLQIFSAIGLYYFLKTISKEWNFLAKLTVLAFIPVFIFSVGRYLHQYYLHTNIQLSKNWIYGRKEAVKVTEKLKDNYDEVYISLNVDMPYIFWLFYSKYDPTLYLRNGGTISGGFADERNRFDKYQFRNFDYRKLGKDKKLLLVGTVKDIPPDAKIIETINYLDGLPGLYIAEN